MLIHGMRLLSRGTVETKEDKTYTGEFSIDRRGNVSFSSITIRGTDVRYILLHEEDVRKVLSSQNTSRNARNTSRNVPRIPLTVQRNVPRNTLTVQRNVPRNARNTLRRA
ncbi:hypothetical protein NEFER01_0527 [Nematocida sp. LUAm1]|nr:hypothetical protein NEFER02_0471 [Nematocida sp. LUAm2]KAI5177252.1 hypothetical protein NEFER01_0527 [Nematocida sp. LUAm1]